MSPTNVSQDAAFLRGMLFYATSRHTFSPFPLFYAPRLSGQARVGLMSSAGEHFSWTRPQTILHLHALLEAFPNISSFYGWS